MKESRVFGMRKIMLGKKTRFRYILFVCRENQFYEKHRIGIWWRFSRGLGLASNPRKEEKYFMLGINFFHINTWIDVKWIGNSKVRHGLLTKDI